MEDDDERAGELVYLAQQCIKLIDDCERAKLLCEEAIHLTTRENVVSIIHKILEYKEYTVPEDDLFIFIMDERLGGSDYVELNRADGKIVPPETMKHLKDLEQARRRLHRRGYC